MYTPYKIINFTTKKDWKIEKEKKGDIPDMKFLDNGGALHAREVDCSHKMKVNKEKLKNMKSWQLSMMCL
ncbi:hypothetical protein BAU27_13165 [Bacillus sp. NH11B]|nr:hypothetical protein BAU27_13165 [Bacillus sp. NH11B]